MKQYLLDTNIVIFLFKSKFRIHEKIAFVGLENCFISEITLAELKIGAEKSADKIQAHEVVNTFAQTVTVLPVSDVLDVFATEKVRLEKSGTPMHDHFDVLLAATALFYNLIMVTNNVKHFTVFPTLPVEDWALQDIPSGFA
jgi:tRNA(fMet)-specific endonuclease VapC